MDKCKSKRKRIILAVILVVIGIIAAGVLALAFYIPELVWMKPIGFLFLAIWGYIFVRQIRKFILKDIDEM